MVDVRRSPSGSKQVLPDPVPYGSAAFQGRVSGPPAPVGIPTGGATVTIIEEPFATPIPEPGAADLLGLELDFAIVIAFAGSGTPPSAVTLELTVIRGAMAGPDRVDLPIGSYVLPQTTVTLVALNITLAHIFELRDFVTPAGQGGDLVGALMRAFVTGGDTGCAAAGETGVILVRRIQ